MNVISFQDSLKKVKSSLLLLALRVLRSHWTCKMKLLVYSNNSLRNNWFCGWGEQGSKPQKVSGMSKPLHLFIWYMFFWYMCDNMFLLLQDFLVNKNSSGWGMKIDQKMNTRFQQTQLESSRNMHSVDISFKKKCFSLSIHLFWVALFWNSFLHT